MDDKKARPQIAGNELTGDRILDGKSILITGGTGSFGHHFVEYALKHYKPKRLVIYSRDEYKQFLMADEYKQRTDALRFFYRGCQRCATFGDGYERRGLCYPCRSVKTGAGM